MMGVLRWATLTAAALLQAITIITMYQLGFFKRPAIWFIPVDPVFHGSIVLSMCFAVATVLLFRRQSARSLGLLLSIMIFAAAVFSILSYYACGWAFKRDYKETEFLH